MKENLAMKRFKKEHQTYVKNQEQREGELRQRCFFFKVSLGMGKYLVDKDVDLLAIEEDVSDAFIEFLFRNLMFIPNNGSIVDSFLATNYSKDQIEQHFHMLKETNKEDAVKLNIVNKMEEIVAKLTEKDCIKFEFGKKEEVITEEVINSKSEEKIEKNEEVS